MLSIINRFLFIAILFSAVACNTKNNKRNTDVAGSNSVTKANMEKVVNSNKYVVVDFYADWCGPCKKMEPAITNIPQHFNDSVVVLRINVDQAKDLSEEMGIQAIPYIVLYKDGQLKNELEGYQSEEKLNQNIVNSFSL